ncbi:MAG: cation:proton antiporter subunit C [Aggregatilineales bacterium]
MIGSAVLYALGGVALFGMGLYAVLAYPNLLRKVLGMNVMGAGAFTILIAAAYQGDAPPDPVPHALVITGIVVAVCATGLALTLAMRIQTVTGAAYLTPDEDEEDVA